MTVEKPTKISITLLIITFLLVFGIDMCLVMRQTVNFSSSSYLDDFWTICIDGKTYTDCTLSSFNFEHLKEKSTVTLTRNVPLSTIYYPVLRFKLKNTALRAYKGTSTDATCIFEKNTSKFLQNTFLGSGIVTIPITDFSPGDYITIELFVGRKNAFKQIATPQIISAKDAKSFAITQKPTLYTCALFLLALGLFGTVLALNTFFIKKTIHSLLTISQLAFWVGCHLVFANGFVEILSSNFALNAILSYGSLLFIVLAFVLHFAMHVAITKKQKQQTNVFLVCLFTLVLCIICAQYAKFALLPILYAILFTFIALFLIIATKIAIINVLKEPLYKATGSVSFIAFELFLLIDAFYYAFSRYLLGSNAELHSYGLATGTTVIVISAVATYIYRVFRATYKSVDSQFKAEAVFLDHTTGAFNRSQSLETLKLLDKENTEYAVVTIDINSNAINDDELQSICKAMRRVFGCYGIVGRLDAQKFVIITAGMMRQKLSQLIFVFNELVAKENSSKKCALNVCVGYAFSTELAVPTYTALYQLAEKRKSKDENYALEKTLVNAKSVNALA